MSSSARPLCFGKLAVCIAFHKPCTLPVTFGRREAGHIRSLPSNSKSKKYVHTSRWLMPRFNLQDGHDFHSVHGMQFARLARDEQRRHRAAIKATGSRPKASFIWSSWNSSLRCADDGVLCRCSGFCVASSAACAAWRRVATRKQKACRGIRISLGYLANHKNSSRPRVCLLILVHLPAVSCFRCGLLPADYPDGQHDAAGHCSWPHSRTTL